jgi:uncharacterized delta-60 repeat protein
MSLSKFLDQESTPVCTGLACLVAVGVEAVIFFASASLPNAGFGAIGIFYLTGLLVLVAVIVNMLLGYFAHIRREYWGGRIALSGIVLWLLTIFGLSEVPRHRAEAAERSRTWGVSGGVVDVVVQADRKLVLLGAGIVRLLPDGAQDFSFHRDYSFKKRGSLPGPLQNQWPNEACAVSLSDGDLLLAANGWVGRIRPDGRDGPSFSTGPPPYSSCWGLAVQPDGRVISGWAFGPSGNVILRNFPDGRLDGSFHAAATPVFRSGTIAVQETGKIVIAGWVRSPDRTIFLGKGNATGCLTPAARFEEDGSADEGFAFAQICRPEGYGAPGPVAYAMLPDSSILFTVSFRPNVGMTSSQVVHLDSRGAEIQKSALRRALQDVALISALAPMSDGRILVGGRRSLVSGRAKVERLLEDGTPDPTFHSHDGFVSVARIRLQGDKILILDHMGNLHRLNPDGDQDDTFHVPLLNVYSQ